jgi:diaminohydroxyphosphoribosylaminopyrimidine deaminase / 5-amino-6-(5-phosphoribosylamino)uracil reductase
MSDMHFIHRCFQLARLGGGAVSPNPQVGSVLVAPDGRIIGEGWHQRYGQAHAEVNAVRSVAPADRPLLPQATLYCSLEPCFHYGKTPPCVELVLAERIPRVVISNLDPNPLTAGQSVAKLRAAGVDVHTGLLEDEGRWLNRAFFTWISQRRPHVVLKWAQSADGLLGRTGEPTPISGPAARRLTHRWRAEADAILVGTTTAIVDNPRLDTRLYPGASPLRIALDFQGKIPPAAHLLNDQQPTWIIGKARPGHWQRTEWLDLDPDTWVTDLLAQLHTRQKAILLVEGGAAVHRQFLEQEMADEARRIVSPVRLGEGVVAVGLSSAWIERAQFSCGHDTIQLLEKG